MELNNPLAFESIQDLLAAILNAVIVLAIPIVVLFIILAGFHYVTAKGNVEKTQKATQSLVFAAIGGVIIVGAVVILGMMANAVNEFAL